MQITTNAAAPRIESITVPLAQGLGPQQVLEQLASLGVEYFVTEQGDLWIKSWQVAAERFVSPAEVPLLQQAGSPAADPLNWVSEHLEQLRAQYPGQWIAVVGNQVQAAAPTLPALLALVSAQGLQKPFVTQVPAGEITWTMTYARQVV
jgi:P2-related tail formation protein